MYCKHCGSKIESNEGAYCKYCGGKVVENETTNVVNNELQTSNQTQKAENPAQTLAILGLVFSFMFALVGLILSAIALKKYKLQAVQDGKGMAVAGLVISIVSVAISVLYFFLIVVAIGVSY